MIGNISICKIYAVKFVESLSLLINEYLNLLFMINYKSICKTYVTCSLRQQLSQSLLSIFSQKKQQ